ncbi:MAG TPA: glutamate--tRNA ligase [Burkholderiaceae bacterium]|nr:glutamate--tRNA ligase [Burkholderiaceae bacterium]
MTLRTRFAPSPTGYVHLGNIRTALFAWAFARHHGGEFLLRIEDTDQERSTQAAVDVVLEVMDWLGLDYDNPGDKLVYQMRRMPRYKEVLAQMLADGRAYHCYTQPGELDALREAQMARGEKPRYDGRWRPEPGKILPAPPAGIQPVIRFRNPTSGTVSWDDGVKGRVEIANAELDDLIIARPDGTPTYNFCVVVDDIDMQITHVIRGDDHVNNTPRQINIMRALGAAPPIYAHTPTVLGADGQKLSKRHGARSVLEYRDEGYLPEAMINMLARLGWSHGDEEIFSREQLVEWFDVTAISASASRFDPEKLAWINAEHIKRAEIGRLADDVNARLVALGVIGAPLVGDEFSRLSEAVSLYRVRVQTLAQLAQEVSLFWRHPTVSDELRAQHLKATLAPALRDLCDRLAACTWQVADIAAVLKAVLAAHQLKMPQLAVPVRVAITGQTQTPSVDAVLWLTGRDQVLARLEAELQRMGA